MSLNETSYLRLTRVKNSGRRINLFTLGKMSATRAQVRGRGEAQGGGELLKHDATKVSSISNNSSRNNGRDELLGLK
jgi:hypothetical protein